VPVPKPADLPVQQYMKVELITSKPKTLDLMSHALLGRADEVIERGGASSSLPGGAAAWPLGARAQQSDQMRRVGFLAFGTVSAWANRIEALDLAILKTAVPRASLGAVESDSTVLSSYPASRACSRRKARS